MDEIGRAGWFGIGVAGMALVGAARAVVGAGHIARELVRSPGGDDRDPVTGASVVRAVSGPGGWILFGALVLAGGAVYHVMAGTGAVVMEAVHAAAK
ncbi:hypothetical protein ACGFX4_07350 [Kitasatospora sp. NPDC048365]|uniref:hypothetical protein n=1 Tax=Kitasatospora sp. NPDC048365 TaxID=3364050 RepID=UPI0037198313